jgi:iron complex outermembrane receptor protein
LYKYKTRILILVHAPAVPRTAAQESQLEGGYMSTQVSQHVRRVLMFSALGLATAGSMAAGAAQPAAGGDLEEVIVTAQNRAQDVNDVPIVIDVVDAKALRDAGFSGMNEIDQISPAVQLNQDQGTVKITLRGVGSQDNAETNDTSVVVNVDGEYINRPNVMSVAMFDMQRVEVLRGPQGTLYGRNSTGGAINFITRKPGHESGANASVSYGNYNALRVDAGADLAFGGDSGLRVAAFHDKHDGYTSHPSFPGFGPFPAYAAGKSDDNKSTGGRVSLVLKGEGALSANFSVEVAQRDFTPGVFAAADLNGAGNGPGATCDANGYTRVAPLYTANVLCAPTNTNFLSKVDRSHFAAPFYGLGWVDQQTWAARARFDYKVSDNATLSYIAGFRHYDETNFKPLPVVYRNYTHLDEADTQSHELRLNGSFGNGVIYQIGAFYFNEALDRAGGFFLPIGPLGSYLSYFRRDLKSESKSVFGQLEFPLSDTLTAVGGLRYTDNSRDGVYNNDGLGTLFNSGPVKPTPAQLTAPDLLYSSNETKATWLAGLNYKPNKDTLVYGKISTGFKGGGFDAVGQYAPETNTAYEAGWKQSFGNASQHQINVSAFYYDYKDLQVSVLLDTTVGGQTFNAGKASIKGFEVEGHFQVSDRDRLTYSFNYLDASYDDLKAMFNAVCVGCDLTSIGDLDPNTAGVQQPNFKGNQAAFSPKMVMQVGYSHDFDLGAAGNLVAGATSKYKTSYFTDFFNYNDSKQKAYTQTNLTLDYKPREGRWSAQAYVHNIEDERALTYGSFIAAGPDDIYNWQFGAPRTYGLRFNVDF